MSSWIPRWLRAYRRGLLPGDLTAGLIVTVMLVPQSLAYAMLAGLRRRENLLPDRELVGLGAANVASALSGGFPVTGGFARSVVNFAAGANTPLAGVVSAALMAAVLAGLTQWFHYLPHAVLAATIIVAVSSLIDLKALTQACFGQIRPAERALARSGRP